MGDVAIRVATGIPGQTRRLLTSSNLWNWLPLATNETGPNGFATFFDPLLPQRFYRAVVP